MKSPERRKLRGWSYSAWQSLQDCPYRFEQCQLFGVKGPTAYPMIRGEELHKKQEAYLRGQIREVPKELASLEDEYRALKTRSPLVEQFWGVNEAFEAFFPDFRKGERSWCVMKMDAALPPSRSLPILYLQDLKTGREYDSHTDQGELYACIGYAHYEAEQVEVEFWYCDQGYPTSMAYTEDQIKNLTEKWIRRGRSVMKERKVYEKTPSVKACQYCFLRSDKQGTCKAWKEVL